MDQYLNSLIAEHEISRAQGSWEHVNLRRTEERFNQIDMRYIDLDGSLKRLYAMVRSDSLEAKPWSFPALLCSSASVKVDSVFIGNTVTHPIRNRLSDLTQLRTGNPTIAWIDSRCRWRKMEQPPWLKRRGPTFATGA